MDYLDQIPDELKRLPQWVCARNDGIPLNPHTGYNADKNDPSDWGTFELARSRGMYVGFVVTKNDPYTIIDMDNKEKNPASPEELAWFSSVVQGFQSYTEVSRSGRGLHTIIRGTLPQGRRHGHMEVYPSGAYVILTGNTLPGYTGIQPRQELLEQLVATFPAALSTSELVETEETMTDDEVMAMACAAENRAKFASLWHGNMEGYPSQSEADFALLSMLAFYSKSNEQVRRLFRNSALGQRDKAQRNDVYLDRVLAKMRAKEPPPIDYTSIALPTFAPEAVEEPVATEAEWAPGFVGELQRYIFESAERPVKEIALVAALGILAGICGRSYNISNSGLNLFLVLLAKTGRGKDEIAKATNRIFKAASQYVPTAETFLGPSSFASQQGLVRTLSSNPCFVSILGEFGATLKTMNDPNTISAVAQLKRAYTDAYSRSGRDGSLRATAYADKEKDTKAVQSPALTLIGETAPDLYYECLSEALISSGFLPRFLVVEYTGIRVARNPRSGFYPPPEILSRICDLMTIAVSAAASNSVTDVCGDEDAYNHLCEYDRKCDERMNNATNETVAELYNRAHLKALRLAGVVAVSTNPHNPVVNLEQAKWATETVDREVQNMVEKFTEGDVGSGDTKQIADVRRLANRYMSMTEDALVAAYCVPRGLHPQGIIPFMYLQRTTSNLAAFKNDRFGASGALTRAISSLIDGGEFQEIPKGDARLKSCNYNGRAFVMPLR